MGNQLPKLPKPPTFDAAPNLLPKVPRFEQMYQGAHGKGQGRFGFLGPQVHPMSQRKGRI